MSAAFAEWRASRAASAAHERKLRRQQRKQQKKPSKPPPPEPESFARICRLRTLQLTEACEPDSHEAGQLLLGTRVRVYERKMLSDGSERTKVALDDGGGAAAAMLGWVTIKQQQQQERGGGGGGASTLLALSPRRQGVPPHPEATRWLKSLDHERRSVEAVWLEALGYEQFRVLRMKGTEDAHSGEYIGHFPKAGGSYACAGCGQHLYAADHKYESTCGWPSFSDNLPLALERRACGKRNAEEILCAGCGGHVGHVFKSSRYPPPKRERHCANSVSLRFVPAAEAAELGALE